MSQTGPIGSAIDRYVLERLLGSGGFGSVYRAQHVHTGVTVALKVLRQSFTQDEQMLQRFLREAKAAAMVGNQHIVGVLDAGVAADGQAFLALEYLEGVDLKELAWREGPLAPARLVQLTLQVLDALAAAHARGIVHRDMKPANVFVVQRDTGDYVKLLDFGISKMRAAGDEAGGLTMTGVALGTPAYMAPEQFFDARNVDGRADVYSVAVMLYELLTNRLPFDADSYAALIVKVKTEEALSIQHLAPHLPAALAHAVMVALAKDPMQRWQSAQDFARALHETTGALGDGQHRAPTPAPAPAVRATGFPLSVTGVPAAKNALSEYRPAAAVPPMKVTGAPPVPQAVASATPIALEQLVQAPANRVAPPKQPDDTRATSNKTAKWILLAVGAVVVSTLCCLGSYVVWAAVQAEAHHQLEQSNEPH